LWFFLPKFVIDWFIGVFNINLKCFKLSLIKKVIFYYFNFNKINLTNFNSGSNNYNFSGSRFNFNSSKDIYKLSELKNKSKRKFFWILWEKYTNNFDSYKTFKDSWDPNVKVRTIIKKDIKDGV